MLMYLAKQANTLVLFRERLQKRGKLFLWLNRLGLILGIQFQNLTNSLSKKPLAVLPA